MPARCAAAPAPTMKTWTPRAGASASSRCTRAGDRCADATVISHDTPSSRSTSTAPCMIGASESEPIRIRTGSGHGHLRDSGRRRRARGSRVGRRQLPASPGSESSSRRRCLLLLASALLACCLLTTDYCPARCPAGTASRRTRCVRPPRRRAGAPPRSRAPPPTTVSTRPPGGDDAAVARGRARVEDEHAGQRGRVVEAGDRLPGLEPVRVAARRQHDADVAVVARPERAGLERARRRRSTGAAARSSSSSGSTTCVSGSPSRTLNSITFGPSAVSISPQ